MLFPKFKKKKTIYLVKVFKFHFRAMLLSVLGLLPLTPKCKGSLAPSHHWLLFRPANGSQNTQLRLFTLFCSFKGP